MNIMTYFDGQTVPMCGSMPKCTDRMAHTPRYFGVQYNHAGRFYLRIDRGRLWEAEGAYAFFTEPGHFYEYGAPAGETRNHNFICSEGPRIAQYMAGGLWNPAPETPLIPVRRPEKFMETMLAVIALARHRPVLPSRAILLYEELLLELREDLEAPKKLPLYQSGALLRLEEDIRNSPERARNFDREAGLLHITATHFRRLFKQQTGLPPQQFLLQCRLQAAAKMLLETDASMAEIAEQTGIGEAFYLSRLFRRKFRLSPLAYRREFRGR